MHHYFLYVLLPLFIGLVSPFSSAPPYPPSPVITNLEWAPQSSITRMANGSDNFPITWGDDGALYTAYGDGNGFDPKVPQKLSLGFARVDGPPTNISAVNVRSSHEQTGQGSAGKKASGMLMVDGVLYMWVRNADNNGHKCQLAWSTDHAQTWRFGDWQFDDFGYCTFINYGQNYAGARDNYVYTVTHDNPSAYTAADRFILMRAPKDQLRNKAAYEYFVGVDGANNPTWSSNVSQRGSVFTNPGLARRSGISYIPGLKRYLWWQQSNNGSEDTRFAGGFGVYDAPEPWGPWTTVYHTDKWDVGPGETGSFPPKWASSDGQTLYLVFSGDDSFSVRKAILTLANGGAVDPPPTPTSAPTFAPTALPPATSSPQPTAQPPAIPPVEPTPAPTNTPITVPSVEPTAAPTDAPTVLPTSGPTTIPPTEPTASPPVEPTATALPDGPTPDAQHAMRSLQVRVVQSEDDAEEDAAQGSVSIRSGDLELSENRDRPQVVGVRFQNVKVPPHARIIDAHIEFQTNAASDRSTSLRIAGEASFNPRAFSDAPYDISSRIRTQAAVDWNDVPVWSAAREAQATPNLAAIVQEVIGQTNWRTGNPMVFIIAGSGKRAATSYDGSADGAPVLVIEYTLPVYLPLVIR
ncbi:MAG: hypothetical protein R3A44_37635 [Caldilineaceae bacterium]